MLPGWDGLHLGQISQLRPLRRLMWRGAAGGGSLVALRLSFTPRAEHEVECARCSSAGCPMPGPPSKTCILLAGDARFLTLFPFWTALPHRHADAPAFQKMLVAIYIIHNSLCHNMKTETRNTVENAAAFAALPKSATPSGSVYMDTFRY